MKLNENIPYVHQQFIYIGDKNSQNIYGKLLRSNSSTKRATMFQMVWYFRFRFRDFKGPSSLQTRTQERFPFVFQPKTESLVIAKSNKAKATELMRTPLHIQHTFVATLPTIHISNISCLFRDHANT